MAAILAIMYLVPLSAQGFEVAETKSQNGQSSRPSNLAPLNPNLAQRYPSMASGSTGSQSGYSSPSSESVAPHGVTVHLKGKETEKKVAPMYTDKPRNVVSVNGGFVVPEEDVTRKVKSLWGRINAFKKETTNLKQTVTQKDRVIDEKDRVIAQKNQVIAKKDEIIGQKDAEIKTLNSDKTKVEEYALALEDQNKGLWAWVVDRHEMVEKLKTVVKDLKEKLADAEAVGWWLTRILILVCFYSVIMSSILFIRAVRKAIRDTISKIAWKKTPAAAPTPTISLEAKAFIQAYIDGLKAKGYGPDDEVPCIMCDANMKMKNLPGHMFNDCHQRFDHDWTKQEKQAA